MKWQAQLPVLLVPVAAQIATAYAADYLSVQQAQDEFFPDRVLQRLPLSLSDAQRATLRARSGVREPFDTDGVWRVLGGGWLVVDHVVGKHEKIGYAVALDASGKVLGVEILSYNESYGSEVRRAEWRQQFVGKTAADPLRLGGDIRNISGATLSSKHVAQGVKRVLELHAMVLAGYRE